MGKERIFYDRPTCVNPIASLETLQPQRPLNPFTFYPSLRNMADLRIKVAKDKAKLVKALRAGDGSTGLFQTYVDVMELATLKKLDS